MDAEPLPAFGQDYFNISSFRLFAEGGSTEFFPPDAARVIGYFDGTIPDANPKQGYLFSLARGEKGQYRVRFLVQEEDIHKPCAICVDVNPEPPSSTKHQILFRVPSDMAES